MKLEDFIERGTAAQKAVDEVIRKAVIKHTRDGMVKCRVCGCSEFEPCEPPCRWQPGEQDLCDSCHGMAVGLREFIEGAHRFSKAALFREVARMQALVSQYRRPPVTRPKGKGKHATP